MEIEKTDISYFRLDQLLLDPENPRLAQKINNNGNQQMRLLNLLYAQENLEELAESFIKFGYFPQEPLVVIHHSRIKNKYTVVEGNRRLAALKILTNKEIRLKLNADSFPKLTGQASISLKDKIPAVVFKERKEIIPYLGFRHITGIKTWSLYAKSKYVANLVEKDEMSLDAVSESMGDISGTIKKLYQAYVVLNQVTELGMDNQPMKTDFGLLTEALSNMNVKKFLQMPRNLPIKRTDSLVGDMKNFRILLEFIFGNKDEGLSRVIEKTKDITDKLGYVLDNDEALHHLIETRSLNDAYDLTSGGKKIVLRTLSNARREIQKALVNIPIYTEKDEDVLRKIEEVQRVLNATKIACDNSINYLNHKEN